MCEVLINCMARNADEHTTEDLLTLSACNLPSIDACIGHMSTPTLGIAVMKKQTEKKKILMLNETLTHLSWVEAHLYDKTYGHNTG